MACVQGLSHLVGRIVARLVDTVRHDSDALFRTIAVENPFVDPVDARFFRAAAELERNVNSPPPGG